jgi:hypothetical protein
MDLTDVLHNDMVLADLVPVMVFCERGDEPSGSIKVEGSLHQLSDC